jgi:hypothetical protein
LVIGNRQRRDILFGFELPGNIRGNGDVLRQTHVELAEIKKANYQPI